MFTGVLRRMKTAVHFKVALMLSSPAWFCNNLMKTVCLLQFCRNDLGWRRGGGLLKFLCCWNWCLSWSLFPLRIRLVSIFVNSSPFLQLPVTDVIISQPKQPVDVHLRGEGGNYLSWMGLSSRVGAKQHSQSASLIGFTGQRTVSSTKVMDPRSIKHGFFYNVSTCETSVRSPLIPPSPNMTNDRKTCRIQWVSSKGEHVLVVTTRMRETPPSRDHMNLPGIPLPSGFSFFF